MKIFLILNRISVNSKTNLVMTSYNQCKSVKSVVYE